MLHFQSALEEAQEDDEGHETGFPPAKPAAQTSRIHYYMRLASKAMCLDVCSSSSLALHPDPNLHHSRSEKMAWIAHHAFL
jgi:hypothetical protein